MRALLVFVMLVGMAGGAALSADREQLEAKATDPETGAFPPGWAIGPALFFKTSPYVNGDRTFVPAPLVYYRGERCSIYVKQGSCRLVGNHRVELSAIADLRLDGYSADDSDFLAGMDDRDFTLHVGLGAEVETPVGDLGLEWVADLLGEHEGHEGAVSWRVPVILKSAVLIFEGAYLFKSQNLADHYYGVRPEEATLTRPAYDVGDTETWSLLAGANVRVSHNWLFVALIEHEFYSSEIEDSPIVDDSGLIKAFASFAYHF